MLRFIQAVLMAFMRIFATTAQGLFDFLDQAIRMTGRAADAVISIPMRLFGGGPAPAPPIKNLDAALPKPEMISQARELAKGEGRAAEQLTKHSAAQQVQSYAMMSKDDRFGADLTLLSADQFDWLQDLTPGQLKILADTSQRRVAAALSGEANALTGIRSVGEREPEVETPLAARIAAFRAGTLRSDKPLAFALN